jgi:hypothetical protein
LISTYQAKRLIDDSKNFVMLVVIPIKNNPTEIKYKGIDTTIEQKKYLNQFLSKYEVTF